MHEGHQACSDEHGEPPRVSDPLSMTTFDAIAQIRREALPRSQALRFLIETFGFTVTYAREVIGAVFGDDEARSEVGIATIDRAQ